jgi:predicted transcriptional regulator
MSVNEIRSVGVGPVTPTQCRMARAALRIGVRELAAIAKVAPGSVARFEAGLTLQDRTIAAMRTALEKAGVQFDVGNGSVRLTPKPKRPK